LKEKVKIILPLGGDYCYGKQEGGLPISPFFEREWWVNRQE
jgi:hypothetical protein